MKKITIIIFLCFVLVLLTSCMKELSYVVDKSEIAFIQIIEVQEHSGEISFSILFQIDEQDITDFINDLALITFTQMYSDPQGFSGNCIYIGYSNEDYEIIGTRYISRYTKFNDIIKWHNYYADSIEFNELIEKYRT